MSKANELTTAEISINGSLLKRFTTVRVVQRFESHHTFEVSIQADMLDTPVARLDELGQKWVGEKAVITLSKGKLENGQIQKSKKTTITGLVTGVRLTKGQGDSTFVVLSGMSPTILLNAGQTTRSFTEKTLSAIVSEVTRSMSGLKTKVSPAYTATIAYITQYEEDNFHFLQRLAETYGEWMYYDGNELVFGKNARSAGQSIPLLQGANLFGMSYQLNAVPLNFKSHYFDYKTDQLYEAPSTGEQVSGLGQYAKVALSKSESLYGDELIELGFQGHQDQSTLKKVAKLKKSEQANRLALLTGQTTESELSVGSLINVKESVKVNTSTTSIDYGQFVVLSVTHLLEMSGSYINTFEAVPQDTDFAPVDYRIQARQAKAHVAVVKDVNDPDKMGRLKVQFSWQQTNNETTPWIRVAQPMSNADKGVFFLPEKGDVVFVDFELGNPDLPFVRGSMYHGTAKPGELFKQDNAIKGIITRSGNHIIIEDTDGGERIHIYNKDKKNEIELSLSGESHINVKSEGTISLEAKTIKLKATTFEMTVDEKWSVEAGQTQISNQQSMAIAAQSEVTVKGATISVEAQAQATVKANGQLTLEASGNSTLKGAMVMIN